MINKQITLYIGGTKLRQAGFSDLTIIGAFPAEEFGKMDRTTLISEKPVCVIKHTLNYCLYQLIDRKVTPSDHDTPGVLSIAMTIPNDMQLAEGKSPYTLLKAVYEKFRNLYMTSYSDGRDKFMDIKVEDDGFREIVAQYSLEKRKGRYVAMGGNLIGTLCVPQNKLEDLFRDSQYTEFANFKDIEIGSNCITTPGLELLEIPRPISYEVWVNGIKKSVSLSKPSDSYATNLTSTEHYLYKNISFTLGELLDADNGTLTQGASYAKLDKENRKIICEVQKVEIKYRGTVKFIDKTGNKEAIQNAIENKEIHIEWGTNYDLMDYQTSGMEFEIPARLLQNANFKITPSKTKEGLKLSVLPTIEVEKQSVTIEVTIRMEDKKPVVVSTGQPGSRKGKKTTSADKEQESLRSQEEAQRIAEENRRKENEKRNKLLCKVFVIGFLSAVILCGSAFVAYWMLKENSSHKEQVLSEKEDSLIEYSEKINNLETKVSNLTNELNEANEKIEELRDSLSKKVPSNGSGTGTTMKPEDKVLDYIKKGEYNKCIESGAYKKLHQKRKNAIDALFLKSNEIAKYRDRGILKKIKKQIPEINNSNYSELTWDRIDEIQGIITKILGEYKK